jgi:thiamine-monophosphate kinase
VARGLDEFGLIARHFAPLAAPGALGLRDDAAILTPAPGMDLVLTNDLIVAGVHFLPGDPADAVAAKLLRVNLSDLAAKGARPLGYLLGLALPSGADEEWVAAFAAGLAADQARFEVGLLGGDTTAIPGPLTLSLTAIGEVPSGSMTRRGGARVGDLVLVSGTIGDGMLGLEVSLGRLPGLERRHAEYLRERYLRPTPRLELGTRLRGIVSAGADISDGLVADLGHIADASGVAARLDLARVPLSEAARAALALAPDLEGRIATGGDDYELVLTVPPAALDQVNLLAAPGLTIVGEIVTGPAGEVRDASGRIFEAGEGGYRHFAGATR